MEALVCPRLCRPGAPRAFSCVRWIKLSELARCGAGQELAEPDEVGEFLLAQPASAADVLGAEVADVRDRASERGDAEPAGDKQHLPRAADQAPIRLRSPGVLWSLRRIRSDHPTKRREGAPLTGSSTEYSDVVAVMKRRLRPVPPKTTFAEGSGTSTLPISVPSGS